MSNEKKQPQPERRPNPDRWEEKRGNSGVRKVAPPKGVGIPPRKPAK